MREREIFVHCIIVRRVRHDYRAASVYLRGEGWLDAARELAAVLPAGASLSAIAIGRDRHDQEWDFRPATQATRSKGVSGPFCRLCLGRITRNGTACTPGCLAHDAIRR